MVGCMVTVALPSRLGTTAAEAMRLRDWLYAARRIEAPIVARGDRLWVRVSAQVYNEWADIEALGDAIDAYRP